MYVVLYIAFKLILEYAYVHIMADKFAYMGTYVDFNLEKYIAGWFAFFFILAAIYFSSRKKDSLYFACNILMVLYITAQISIYGLTNSSTDGFLQALLYWFIFFTTLLLLSKIKLYNIDDKKLPNNKKGVLINTISRSKVTTSLLLLSIGVTFWYYFLYSDFKFSFTDISDLANNRMAFREQNAGGYLMTWVGGALLPYLFVVYSAANNIMRSTVIFFLSFMLLMVNGMKTWIIYLIVAFFLRIISAKNIYWIINAHTLAIIIGTTTSIVIYYTLGEIVYTALIWRTLWLPSSISYMYYDFFQSNELLYLTQSILRHFFEGFYNRSIGFVIGEYAGSGIGNANNGLFGDAYANLGVVGVIVFPALFAVAVYILIDLLDMYNDRFFSYSMSYIFMWNAVNSPFFSWILTGGILPISMVIWITLKYNIDTHKTSR